MGRFTVLDAPLVDQTIEAHLQQVITAVRSRIEPESIILRGSFGRGEGSVVVQDGQLRFLSDYEIDVATSSPFYRSLFAELSHQLTIELGVETSLRWVRPDYMSRHRVGPLPMGPALPSISLYESRYGSWEMYGQRIIASGPPIDPCQISLYSGITLLLNRMAESLYYVPIANDTVLDDLEVLHWVSKTTLACAESLLLLWGQYHYSYRERGRRFAALANGRLGFMQERGSTLAELVARATEFKLRPRRALYRDAIPETWLQVIPVCDTVFRYLTEQVLNFSFSHYVEFPQAFLQNAAERSSSLSRAHFLAVKLLDLYKYLRTRRVPRGLLLPFAISRVVYAVVPLLFVGRASKGETLRPMLSEVRQWLKVMGPLEPLEPNPWDEWNGLRRHMLWAWKNFCY